MSGQVDSAQSTLNRCTMQVISCCGSVCDDICATNQNVIQIAYLLPTSLQNL